MKNKKSCPLASRIKKLMQTDEDVGKIAQASPVLIGRAMELFLQQLCKESCEVAKARDAKTVTASHLKAYIMREETMDFLKDTVANVPDLKTEDADGPKVKRRKTNDQSDPPSNPGSRPTSPSHPPAKLMSHLSSNPAVANPAPTPTTMFATAIDAKAEPKIPKSPVAQPVGAAAETKLPKSPLPTNGSSKPAPPKPASANLGGKLSFRGSEPWAITKPLGKSKPSLPEANTQTDKASAPNVSDATAASRLEQEIVRVREPHLSQKLPPLQPPSTVQQPSIASPFQQVQHHPLQIPTSSLQAPIPEAAAPGSSTTTALQAPLLAVPSLGMESSTLPQRANNTTGGEELKQEHTDSNMLPMVPSTSMALPPMPFAAPMFTNFAASNPGYDDDYDS